MEEQMARRLVAAEGKKLQQAGLVARTWGNISCRIDENHFVITPSGLDYETMTARDLVLMDIRNGVCCGAHKPSSEKGVHLAAYQTFPEVGYVIHTHQTYATAIGLCGFEQLAMTEEEAEKLGGIAGAAYGLSSTEKLAGGRVYHQDTGIIENTRDKRGAGHHHAGNDPARDDRAASGAV